MSPFEQFLWDLLSIEFMLGVWLAAFIFPIVVAHKTGLYVLLVVSGGILPQIIYRVYIIFDWFPSSDFSHFYARASDISLVISLVLAWLLMLRGFYHGRR